MSNQYVTLTEFKAQIGIGVLDTDDDTNLETMLEAASRMIDDACGRYFYPAYETRYFDTPTSGDKLTFWYDDLLEVVTLTNGSYGALSSTSYISVPYNDTPYIAVKLKPNTGISWESDTDNITEAAIQVAGFWGYRAHYSRDGWHSKTTLSGDEDIDTTALSVTDDTGFYSGDIVRIDNELMLVTADPTGGNVLTVQRAYNGSTAATHTSGAAVKRWRPEPAVAKACAIQAHRLFKRKDSPFGIAGAPYAGGELVLLKEMDADVKTLIRPFVRMY